MYNLVNYIHTNAYTYMLIFTHTMLMSAAAEGAVRAMVLYAGRPLVTEEPIIMQAKPAG